MARTARQKGYRPYARAPASLTPSAGDVRTSVISNTHTHTNTHSHVAHAMPLPVVVVLVFFFWLTHPRWREVGSAGGSGGNSRTKIMLAQLWKECHSCTAATRTSARAPQCWPVTSSLKSGSRAGSRGE